MSHKNHASNLRAYVCIQYLGVVLCICTEMANSSKLEQEDTLLKDNECNSDNHCSAELEGVNNNENRDENKNTSSRGDILHSTYFLLVPVTHLEDLKI